MTVILVTALLVYELYINSARSARQVRMVVSSPVPLGPGCRGVRRAAVHLRNPGDHRAGDDYRNPAGRGRRDFSGRTGAAPDFLRPHLSDRTAGRGAQRDHRPARRVCPDSDSPPGRCRRSKARLGWTPLFQGPFYGVSLFAAGVVLAIMILPFIISISREVILAVPGDQREAALALGATRWETTWDVVVPYARKGITGSIFLALARALGETMAVTMVVGNDPKISALAARAGILDCRGDRQRIHGGHRRSVPGRPDRAGPGAVRADHRHQRRGAAAGGGHHRERERA